MPKAKIHDGTGWVPAIVGAQGPTGPQGIQGIQGTPGADGADGADAGVVPTNTVAASGATLSLDTQVLTHDITMDQDCTFTFTNPPGAGESVTFTLILRGAFTPTLPASIDWAGATPPTYETPAIYVFTTVDQGTTWLGAFVGGGFA